MTGLSSIEPFFWPHCKGLIHRCAYAHRRLPPSPVSRQRWVATGRRDSPDEPTLDSLAGTLRSSAGVVNSPEQVMEMCFHARADAARK